ncbi:MAG: DUF5320 domain-containing protein [Planctomycetota bacterium]
MPGGDGTGPMGMGPMTGRAAGYCAGFPVPGFMNPGAGFGFGGQWSGRGFRGRGGGRGRRNWFYATGLPGWMRAGYAPGWGTAAPFAAPGREDQARALREQAEFLESSLADVRQHLADLEKSVQDK